MVNDSAKTAILLTVAYSDQFDFPLTAKELYLRLIWRHDSAERLSFDDFSLKLRDLIKDGVLETSDGYYFLKNRAGLVEIRSRRQKYAVAQREELKPLLAFLRKIPWISGVVLTGSLALNAISSTDDSDFLLVVMPKRLWLTRVLVIFYAWMKGKRRSWRYEEENSWCFNLWLDSDHLGLPPEQHSIYTAYEVCQADWLWWRGSTAGKFYSQNSWVKNLLPAYWQYKADLHLSGGGSGVGGWSQDWLRNPLSPLVDLLDYLAFLFQLWYMKPHRTREKVGRGMAFFHPRDTRSMINTGWRDSIKRIAG